MKTILKSLRHEVVTTAALILVAVIAMYDSLKRAGWTASGPDAGWYPFWSAAMMGIASVVILFITLRKPRGKPFFESEQGARTFWQLAVPMVVMIALINWLGYYLVSALYMGFFARWIGKYHWLWVIVIALSVPIALYLGFERAFQAPLPKSMFYNSGLIPF